MAGSRVGGTALGLAAFFGSAVVFDIHVASHTAADGPSMSPTLVGLQERVVFERVCTWPPHRSLCWLRRGLRRGDVVVSRQPLDARAQLIKRVVGLPGDVLDVWGRQALGPPRRVVVPPGHCWLQGDNVAISKDSRDYGPVPLAMVMGRAVATVWPPRHAGWIDSRMPLVSAAKLVTPGDCSGGSSSCIRNLAQGNCDSSSSISPS